MALNVLAINPNREQMPWPAVPIGLCTVATSLFRAGHDVDFLDLTFSRAPREATRKALRARCPEAVAITIRNIDNCNFESPVFYLEAIRNDVIRTVREVAPDAIIVIGGSAVNVSPQDCFDYLEADYALIGDGEEALPRLLTALAGGAARSIPGLLSRRERRGQRFLPTVGPRPAPGEPVSGRAVVADLAASARSEAWRWVDLRKYAARGGPYSVQTKRGCALKCVYCVYNAIEGRNYRLRSAEDIVDEIEQAVGHGARQIDFVDSTFNLPLSHGRAVCEALAHRALPVDYSTMGLNPAGVKAEFIQSMKRAGFKSVMCTPESASDTTLRSLQKGYDKGAVIRAAQALRGADLRTFWFFMLGAPGETVETVRETLQFCEDYIPSNDMVLFTTGIRVYSGTPLERYCKDEGWFDESDPLFFPSWYLSPELDLGELYRILVRAADSHPNWMTNAETILTPARARLMKGAFKMIGWRGPFWHHLPKFHGVVSRFGARHRGLEVQRARMERIADVAHYDGEAPRFSRRTLSTRG